MARVAGKRTETSRAGRVAAADHLAGTRCRPIQIHFQANLQANSRPISSAQQTAHAGIAHLLERHLAQPFQRPIAFCNQQAFEVSIAAWRNAGAAPLILDAGCGVGLSTLALAAQFPDHFVIGVDQSANRLARQVRWPTPLPRNQIRVRANLVDYWRLLRQASIGLARHYLLYPNPWPKIGQLQRRWHGHPVFPDLVGLGGVLECRSNWGIYIEEFAEALTQVTAHPVVVEPYQTTAPMTPFEAKYLASGQALWRCRIQLPG